MNLQNQDLIEELQRLYDDAPCGYHSLDPDGKFLNVNKRELLMLGYQKEEMIGQKITKFFTAESIKIFKKNFPQFKQGNPIHDLEFEMIAKNGSIMTVSVSAIPMFDELGNYLKSHSVMIDISERKQLEKERTLRQLTQQKEIQFDLALEITETGTWDWDLVTGEISWNKSHYTLLGYEPWHNASNYELWRCRVHPDEVTEVEQKLSLALEKHTNYEAEFRVIWEDGTIHWLLGKGRGIYDETGQAIRMIGTIVDITQRKEAELALQESQEQLSLFVKYAPVSVAMFDHKMCYLAVSQKWIETYHLESIEFILGRSHYEIFPNISEFWRQEHQKGLAGNVRKCEQDHFILPDGSEQWLNWEIQPWYLNTKEVGGILIFVEDITQRKQAELALQKTQETLNIAIEASQMGTWYLDLVNDVSSVRSFRHDQIFGYDTPQTEWGEAIARRHVVAEDQTIWDEAFASAMKTGELNFEVRIRWSDGSIHWMGAYGHFYFNEKGNPLYGAGVNLDITERKQAEIALKEQLTREQLIKNIATNIRKTLELDEVLQITVNEVRALLNADRVIIFRFQPDWSGKVITESVNKDYPSIVNTKIYDPCFMEKYQEVYLQGQVTMRTDFHTEDIEPCYLELIKPFQVRANLVVPIIQGHTLLGLLIAHQCSAPRHWQASEIELLQQLATHVSIAIQQAELFEQTRQELLERQKAQEKIAQQAALLDITTDAITVRDLDQNILFWNKSAERLYGWKAEEVIGKTIYDVLYKDYNYVLKEVVTTVLKKGFWQGELAQITKTGKEIIVDSRWNLVKNDADQPESILVVNTDITEKKQLEQQFYQAQRLESIGTLASGIAHDLNNVFTPILGIVQLLPLKFKNLDQRTIELLKILDTSVRRGIDLVKQILTFARIKEGTKDILELNILLKEITKIMKQTLPKNITIELEIEPDSILLLDADSTQLHQVFMNLIINARDAMPEGGNINIFAKNQYLDDIYGAMNLQSMIGEYREGQYIVVSVKDTGIGINPEILHRIFDPFFTTKEVGKGTGLGLSTILGIVKNHHGFVQVFSEVGKGTEFKIYLPPIQEYFVNNEEISVKIEPENTELRGNGETILIVDDEKFIQEIIKISLEDHHYQTMIANDGIEAIAMYSNEREKIKLILMDIMMPSLDGITAIRTLKSINPNVKIIANSGLIEHEQTALNMGADVFLVKPYTTEELLKIVKQLIL